MMMNALSLQIQSNRKEYFLREKSQQSEKNESTEQSENNEFAEDESVFKVEGEVQKGRKHPATLSPEELSKPQTPAKVTKMRKVSKVVKNNVNQVSTNQGSPLAEIDTNPKINIITNTQQSTSALKNVAASRGLVKTKVASKASDSDDTDRSELGDQEIDDEERFKQAQYTKIEQEKQVSLSARKLSVSNKSKGQATAAKKSMAKQSMAKQSVAAKSKVSSDLVKIKEETRKTWFDPNKYDMSRIRHPKKIKKELPADADIFCLKCNETFDSTDDLVAHEKRCFKGRQYSCEFAGGCNLTFSQKSLMHQHLKAVHYNDPFICDFCSQTFVYKKSLDTHLIINMVRSPNRISSIIAMSATK